MIVLVSYCLLGLVLHVAPNWGVPLHSDTAWLFLLMAAPVENVGLSAAIPDGFKLLGAYPQDPVNGFVALHQSTGRLNVVDDVLFWFTARIAAGDADLWRLFPVLLQSLAVGLFYLICVEMRLSRGIALLLSLTLAFEPLETWVDYNKSESKAVFFLMLGLYASLASTQLRFMVVSALALALSVLTKETFLAAWLLVPALTLFRLWAVPGVGDWHVVRRAVTRMWPHVAALALLGLYALLLRSCFTPAASYVTPYQEPVPLLPMLGSYATGLVPGLPQMGRRQAFGLIVSVFFALWLIGRARRSWRSHQSGLGRAVDLTPYLVVSVALVAALAAHAVPYLLSQRPVVGRYLVPANFEFALLGAIVLTGVWRGALLPAVQGLSKPLFVAGIFMLLLVVAVRLDDPLFSAILASLPVPVVVAHWLRWSLAGHWARYVLFLAATVFLLSGVDKAIDNAASNRMDQLQWQALIEDAVRTAPEGAHVVLDFEEPLMIEMAYSLEASTLLRGRYDLTYSVRFQDTSAYAGDAGYLRFQVDGFNMGRPQVATLYDRPIVTVHAARGGTNGSQSTQRWSLGEELRSFVQSPGMHMLLRYSRGKVPYLGYQLSVGPS